MSKRNLLAGTFAIIAAAAAGTAMAQTEDTMSVYVGNLPDLEITGDTEAVVEVPLPVASEACGVDLKFIEAWAASGSRYCVALHPVAALNTAIKEQLGGE